MSGSDSTCTSTRAWSSRYSTTSPAVGRWSCTLSSSAAWSRRARSPAAFRATLRRIVKNHGAKGRPASKRWSASTTRRNASWTRSSASSSVSVNSQATASAGLTYRETSSRYMRSSPAWAPRITSRSDSSPLAIRKLTAPVSCRAFSYRTGGWATPFTCLRNRDGLPHVHGRTDPRHSSTKNGASVHVRQPVHLHTAFAGARRPQQEIDRHSCRCAAAVRSSEARGHKVDRTTRAHAGGKSRHGANRARVTERECPDLVLSGRRRGCNHELLGALPHVLGSTEEGIRSVQIERTLHHDAAREPPTPNLVVRAVDQGARPRPPGADRLRGQRGRSDSVEGLVGVELFRASQVSVPGRHAPTRSRIHSQAGAVGIEPSACVVEVGPNLVGLPAVEPRSFELHVPAEDPRGHDPKRDVGAVLPVMGDRCQRIIGRGRPVREGHGAHRWLADRRQVE